MQSADEFEFTDTVDAISSNHLMDSIKMPFYVILATVLGRGDRGVTKV